MRISTLFLLAFLLTFFPAPSHATHSMGSSISYECLGGCTYRIYLDRYYECAAGIPTSPPGSPFIDFSPSACTPPVATSAWILSSFVEATPICPELTICRDPFALLYGQKEVQYYRDFDFCNANCTLYTVEWEECCRNSVLTSGSDFAGLGATLGIDLGQAPCNNSPRFITIFTPYICAGQAFSVSQGAFDPDGDSLVYSLATCLSDAAGNQVPYNTGYSPTAPMGPSWNVNLNTQTGQIDFVPTPGNMVAGPLCIQVDEYRNGQLIGQINRDFAVTVIHCGTPVSTPIIDSVHSIMNATQRNAYSFQVFTGASMSMTFEVSDGDAGDSVFVSSTIQSVFPGATIATTGVNPIQATVTFTGTAPGFYGFGINFFDTQCPLPHYVGRSYWVEVIDSSSVFSQPLVSLGSDTTLCVGESLVGTVVDSGTPPYDFVWSTGDTILGNLTGVSQATVSASGTYTVKVTDAAGYTTYDTIQVNAVPLPDATFSANPSSLTVTFNNISGANTTWNWDFGDGNTDSGSPGTSHTYAANGTYTVTLITTNDCGSDTTTQVISFTVGLDENEFSNSISIQPNPFSSSTFVSFDNPTRNEISVFLYDLQGRQVREYATTGEQVEVVRGELVKGIYLLEVWGDGVYYGRVVVE